MDGVMADGSVWSKRVVNEDVMSYDGIIGVEVIEIKVMMIV